MPLTEVQRKLVRRPAACSMRGKGGAMDQVQEASSPRKPLWRRIVDFPLVAMVIAVVICMLCFTVGLLIAQYLVPPIPGFNTNMKFDLFSLPLLVLAYLFVITRLGDPKRNDYRDPIALRNLGLGLAAGFVVFSLAVAIAALLGVYRITG